MAHKEYESLQMNAFHVSIPGYPFGWVRQSRHHPFDTWAANSDSSHMHMWVIWEPGSHWLCCGHLPKEWWRMKRVLSAWQVPWPSCKWSKAMSTWDTSFSWTRLAVVGVVGLMNTSSCLTWTSPLLHFEERARYFSEVIFDWGRREKVSESPDLWS